jgi:putative transcriptional regulator
VTKEQFVSSLPERQYRMKGLRITMKMGRPRARPKSTSGDFDWSRFDAMTDEEVEAAALSDPDAQRLTDADMKRMKRTPQVKVIRRAFRMSQEEFAQAFRIPIGTLRDWEQGRVEPDHAARLPQGDRAQSQGRARGAGAGLNRGVQ